MHVNAVVAGTRPVAQIVRCGGVAAAAEMELVLRFALRFSLFDLMWFDGYAPSFLCWGCRIPHSFTHHLPSHHFTTSPETVNATGKKKILFSGKSREVHHLRHHSGAHASPDARSAMENDVRIRGAQSQGTKRPSI